MAALTAFVHVTDEKGAAHIFGPGSDVPAWAAKLITNEKAWDEKPEQTDGSEEPNRSGKGAGLEAWQKYATSIGITFEPDTKREEIIALVDAAKPTK